MAEQLNQTIEDYKSTIDQLTQENTTIKKYIGSLETEVNLKTKEINEKNKVIRDHEEKLDALKGEEKKLADTIAEERKRTEQLRK